MTQQTKIEWTDFTVNFWEGCQKVGPGCDHCYAEARDMRFTGGQHWGPGAPRRKVKGGLAKLRRINRDAAAFKEEHGHWPRVFCSSLSDVFDTAVPKEWRVEAFVAMAAAFDTRIQLLTKRIGNVEKMVPPSWRENLWPARIGLMITVVNQEEADRDIPKLLDLKARLGIPWVGLSVEPMLGQIDLTRLRTMLIRGAECINSLTGEAYDFMGLPMPSILPSIDWVICGGESGPNARPMDPEWARILRDQCQAASVPYLFKQWGEFGPVVRSKESMRHPKPEHLGELIVEWPAVRDDDCFVTMRKMGKAKAGRLLDGRTWDGVIT